MKIRIHNQRQRVGQRSQPTHTRYRKRINRGKKFSREEETKSRAVMYILDFKINQFMLPCNSLSQIDWLSNFIWLQKGSRTTGACVLFSLFQKHNQVYPIYRIDSQLGDETSLNFSILTRTPAVKLACPPHRRLPMPTSGTNTSTSLLRVLNTFSITSMTTMLLTCPSQLLASHDSGLDLPTCCLCGLRMCCADYGVIVTYLTHRPNLITLVGFAQLVFMFFITLWYSPTLSEELPGTLLKIF